MAPRDPGNMVMKSVLIGLLSVAASLAPVSSATHHRLLLDTCGEGQVANSQGVCISCAAGYIRTSASPLVCSACPCVSAGSCQLDTASSQVVCVCPHAYYGVSTAVGTLCQQCPGYNSTSQVECSGHGTCTPDPARSSDPTCSCARGYTGRDCFACALGYTGPDCQQCSTGFVSVNGQCTACPGYCSGGQGTCQVVDGKATCRCARGWSGTQCERPDTEGGYFLVYDEGGALVNGTVSSEPQHCSMAAECGFNTACVDSFCQCLPGSTTAGAWFHAGSVGIKCSGCPLGSYRDDVSTLPCTACPYNRSTTATPGATSPDQCIACSNDQMVCGRGTTFDAATCLCEETSASTAGLNVGSKVAIGILVPVAFIALLGAGAMFVVRSRQEKLARRAGLPTGLPSSDSPPTHSGLPVAQAPVMTDSERRENDSM